MWEKKKELHQSSKFKPSTPEKGKGLSHSKQKNRTKQKQMVKTETELKTCSFEDKKSMEKINEQKAYPLKY